MSGLPGYDAWRTSGRYSSQPVFCTCKVCEEEWSGVQVSEYGTGWLEPHEECPNCGSEKINVATMDATDIAEERYEASSETRGLL